MSTLENTDFWAEFVQSLISHKSLDHTYIISGFSFLMDLLQVPQWWSINPSISVSVASFWIKRPPQQRTFPGLSVVTVTGPCLNSTWGIPELSQDQEPIKPQGKGRNYHCVFAKGLVGEPQALRKCNCVVGLVRTCKWSHTGHFP